MSSKRDEPGVARDPKLPRLVVVVADLTALLGFRAQVAPVKSLADTEGAGLLGG